MNWDRDIKFPEKKVDQSWKEEIHKVKGGPTSEAAPSAPKGSPSQAPSNSTKESKPTNRTFVNLISSLGYQALMHLGEIPVPETGQTMLNPEAAQETIELLMAIQQKTEGNLSPQEQQMLVGLVSELQVKFSGKV